MLEASMHSITPPMWFLPCLRRACILLNHLCGFYHAWGEHALFYYTTYVVFTTLEASMHSITPPMWFLPRLRRACILLHHLCGFYHARGEHAFYYTTYVVSTMLEVSMHSITPPMWFHTLLMIISINECRNI
jgi:hypothetical protein